MRFFLALLLPFHWMVVFALLAMLTVSAPDELARVASLLGATVDADALPDFGAAASAGFAVAFALVSALFLWMLLAVAFGSQEFPGPAEEVAGAAFGISVGTTTGLLFVAVAVPASGLFMALGLQLAALTASYVAINAERRAAALVVVEEGGGVRAAARLMAVGAAHSSVLAQVSRRGAEASI